MDFDELEALEYAANGAGGRKLHSPPTRRTGRAQQQPESVGSADIDPAPVDEVDEPDGAPQVVLHGSLYKEKEGHELSDEEKARLEEARQFRLEMELEMEAESRQSVQDVDAYFAFVEGTRPMALFRIRVPSDWGRDPVAGEERFFLDLMTVVLLKLKALANKQKGPGKELSRDSGDLIRRISAFGDFLSSFARGRFDIAAVGHFCNVYEIFAKPKDGVHALYSEWFKDPTAERAIQLRLILEHRFKCAFDELMSCLRYIKAQVDVSEICHVESVVLHGLLFPHIRLHGLLPPVEPPEQRLEIRLSVPTASEEMIVEVHESLSTAALRNLLVDHLHYPQHIKLLQRGEEPGTLEEISLSASSKAAAQHGSILIRGVDSVIPRLVSWDNVALVPYPSDEPHFKRWQVHERLMRTCRITMSRMLWDLRSRYRVEDFQKQYKALRRMARPGDSPHVDFCLSVQKLVLPDYGFEGSTTGVTQMRQETSTLVGGGDHIVRKLMQDIHRLLEYGQPLPKMPIVRPLEAPRFVAHQKDRWLRHLTDEGFVVIANVATADEVETAYSLLWDFIEQSDSGRKIRSDDVSTWQDDPEEDGCGWPAGRDDGIIHGRSIGQSEMLWFLRSLPTIKQVFADIWGTKHLVTSLDGAGVFRPYGHDHSWKTTKTNWFHVDQAHTKPGLHCIQGLITLMDATPQTGGFVCVPGSNRFHGQLLRNSKRKEWNFLSVNANDPILTEGDGGPRLICARSGDLILWDSRTVHCNSQPLVEDKELLKGRNLIRAVAYICMTPAAWCSKETARQREHAFRRGVTSSHWPHEFHAMTIHRNRAPFHLTNEQKILLCPQAEIGWHDGLLKEAPKEGRISVLPAQRFEVIAPSGADVRESPTTEWGEPVSHLEKGSIIEGYALGKWIRLTSVPEGKINTEERWTALDWSDIRAAR